MAVAAEPEQVHPAATPIAGARLAAGLTPGQPESVTLV